MELLLGVAGDKVYIIIDVGLFHFPAAFFYGAEGIVEQ